MLLIVFLQWRALPAHASQQVKVDLCHKTASETNPWVVQEVNANEVQSHLDNGDLLIDADHPCPPQSSPTPTPSASPTATPNPCEDENADVDELAKDEVCPTPTPSPTGSPTPSESPSPTPEESTPPVVTHNDSGGGDGKQADTACMAPVEAAKLQGFSRDGGDVTFSWWPSTDTSVTSQSIVYGYDENNLNMGVNGLPSSQSSFTIHGLAPQMVWAQIFSYTDGGCAIGSNKLDP